MRRIAVFCVFFVPAMWGCIPLDQHKALREAYDKLDADRQTSKKSLQAANQTIAKLTAEVKQARDETQDLQARLQQTTQHLAELSAQLEAAKKAQAALEEERVKSAKESKPARNEKPSPRRKK